MLLREILILHRLKIKLINTIMTLPELKILIIGAGPGGLVLAHALDKVGIAYEIFDREDPSKIRGQGWAVALIEYVFFLVAPKYFFRSTLVALLRRV